MKPGAFFFRCVGWAACLACAAVRASASDTDSRLVNLSTRAGVAGGADVLVTGFVLNGPAANQILLRAAGPSLTKLGVPGALAAPRLRLFDAPGNVLATNQKWDPALKATFTQAGAFAFTDNSQDAALLVTLEPGSYTAQISGVNDTTGNALVEVYNLTGGSRLINFSSRARIETSAGLLISGFVVGQGTGLRRLLLRAAGPALTKFGVSGLADPALALLNSNGQQLMSNDNWEDGGRGENVRTMTLAAGAFAFDPGSKDAALAVDLPAGSYSLQVSGIGGATGTTLIEVYDLTPPGDSAVVSVVASVPAADRTGNLPAVFTFSRTGDLTAPLTVSYSLTGTALAGVDFTPPGSTIVFGPGAATATLNIAATGDGGGALTKTLALSLATGASYNVGTASSASVALVFDSGSLYIARLRPPATATSTGAYGTATVHLSSDETTAIVSVNFANLSGPETNAYLFLGEPGDSGALSLVRLPNGPSSSTTWSLTAAGSFSVADVVQALKTGRVFIAVGTAPYPDGELAGPLVRGAGAQTFITPAAPPPPDLAHIAPAEASRFLTQATFGPRAADIDALIASGYGAWLDAQMTLPSSSQREATMADFAAKPPVDTTQPNGNALLPNGSNRQAAWFHTAVYGPDQLRQRIAFALSELFVVSDVDGQLVGQQEALANYYDIFTRNAFGSFRQILGEVTFSPVMGVYLSHLRNARTDPKTGAMPDENYAREVMQLFSIGLNELLPDGTLKLDAVGQPIPTYDQATITETARVFTGWSYHSNAANPNFRTSSPDRFNPMMIFPAFHDDGAKTIVTGRRLPAGQGGQRDVEDTLDTLFTHSNTGPFVARQLIQRLVTSNPSPGYVYRVARAFDDNGSGVRGDLGAVVRAILLDYEARSPQVLALPGYGRLKEPLLRVTALLRAFNAFTTGINARLYNPTPEESLGQAALRAPTVFNFFEPDYLPPGRLAAAGLVAPEFQILNDTTSIATPNTFYQYAFPGKIDVTTIQLALDDVLPLVAQPESLVDRMNLIFCAGQMRPVTRTRLLSALGALPASATAMERARTAIYLTVNSPDAAVQQ